MAGIFNFLSPGMGHLFLGRARRYFVPLSIVLLVALGLSQAGWISTLAGFGAFVGLILGLVLFGVIDGILVGARHGRETSRWYSRWFIVLGWFIAIQALAFQLSSHMDGYRRHIGYALYRIPGPLMRPTLAPGDIILTSSHAPSKLAPRTLVVFRHPNDGALHVLRIKQETSPGVYSLDNGLPFAWSIDDVPQQNIVGLVTALIWSPERKQFARRLE